MTPQEQAAFEALVEAKRLTDQMDTFTDAEIAFVFKESFGWAFVWSPRCMALADQIIARLSRTGEGSLGGKTR